MDDSLPTTEPAEGKSSSSTLSEMAKAFREKAITAVSYCPIPSDVSEIRDDINVLFDELLKLNEASCGSEDGFRNVILPSVAIFIGTLVLLLAHIGGERGDPVGSSGERGAQHLIAEMKTTRSLILLAMTINPVENSLRDLRDILGLFFTPNGTVVPPAQTFYDVDNFKAAIERVFAKMHDTV